jgi:hypothetical protein
MDKDTDVTFYRQPSVFLNGCLHIMGHSMEYSMIFAVDMEGNTWRKIDRPTSLHHSMHQAHGHLMHQAQGHLCVCIVLIIGH